jgi:hypothetical protein
MQKNIHKNVLLQLGVASMDKMWQDFKKTFVAEIGEELAELFVGPLHSHCHGNIHTARRVYFEIGLQWAPVILAWRDWVLKKAFGRPVLVMRDAKPLSAVPISEGWQRVWLNRKICGVSDEISGDAEQPMNPSLNAYIRQCGLEPGFTFVDSGCWGTLIKEFCCRLGMEFQPLFFFSHNPNIPGFLNELGVDDEGAEILNDSLECCFPNMVERPTDFIWNMEHRIAPDLKATDELSAAVGREVLNGVGRGAMNGYKSIKEAVSRLLDKSSFARRGKFTGILPKNSPTWSCGAEFLVTWPKNLHWD